MSMLEAHEAEHAARRRRAARMFDMTQTTGWADLRDEVGRRAAAYEEKILSGKLTPSEYAEYTWRRIGLLEAVNVPRKEAEQTNITQMEEFVE